MQLNFYEAFMLYSGRFGHTPSIVRLDAKHHKAATLALLRAIDLASPLTDEDFYKACGVVI